ncbi:MAG: zinc-binding alcohol dehydrogenase, partial [Hyphomicrobiales bacterium]|nr:zinc-binding alcohol dehydrogenase [Hyphomicrobiales bacterium]
MPAGGQDEQDPTGAARALWYVGDRCAEIRAAPLVAPRAGEVLVRTRASALSRGTERLVFSGAVPASEYETMRAPMQAGDFPFPVKYGYAAVGVVERGPSALRGRRVFALHPHQDRFIAAEAMALPIPDAVPDQRATLAANMETALNALWDSGAAPGDRIAVVGGGAVGLLITALAARLPGAEVTLIDPQASRQTTAASFGAAFSTDAGAARECDVVFHASATSAGLAAAISACGLEATLVEASWYGARSVEASLGGAFHAKRIRIVSSQVGQVAPSHRPRWTHRRRLEKALALLADARFDLLLGERVPFDSLPAALP